eukprot:3484412-Prymnesium_polylepis.2
MRPWACVWVEEGQAAPTLVVDPAGAVEVRLLEHAAELRVGHEHARAPQRRRQLGERDVAARVQVEGRERPAQLGARLARQPGGARRLLLLRLGRRAPLDERLQPHRQLGELFEAEPAVGVLVRALEEPQRGGGGDTAQPLRRACGRGAPIDAGRELAGMSAAGGSHGGAPRCACSVRALALAHNARAVGIGRNKGTHELLLQPVGPLRLSRAAAQVGACGRAGAHRGRDTGRLDRLGLRAAAFRLRADRARRLGALGAPFGRRAAAGRHAG